MSMDFFPPKVWPFSAQRKRARDRERKIERERETDMRSERKLWEPEKLNPVTKPG